MRRFILALLVLPGLLAAGVGCTSDDAGESSEVRVVASTALIAEFASTVAGEDAVVVGLIPPGVDLHSFEPAPGIAASIAQADLILVNGHGLEGTLLEVIEQSASGGVPIVSVSDGLDVLEAGEGDGHDEDDGHGDDDHGEVDPHLWLDVRNAMGYVETIRDALIEVSPEFESGYRERADGYLAELESLDAEVRAAVETIPAGARQLVVFHDAYSYLAEAYGLELLAAVLPAGGQQDPSAGTVAELIELLRASEVGTVFAEPQFNSTVLEQIASEADVEVGVLYSTFAGDIESYAGLMRANSEALVEGLKN